MPYRLSTMNRAHFHRSFPILTYLVLWTCLPLSSITLSTTTATPVRCSTADWRSIVVFYIINYVAHAATVPSDPGEKWHKMLPWTILSLLLPLSTFGNSVGHILNHFSFWHDDLGKAIARGAIVVAGRSKQWMPSVKEELVYINCTYNFMIAGGSEVKFTISENETFVNDVQYHIQGQTKLPSGYHWVVPPREVLEDLADDLRKRDQVKLGRPQNWLKMLISVAQLIFSSATIYNSRGRELDRYGYAAFGLSVFPYTLMSLVNLVSLAIVGEYPCLYTLQTEISEEARGRGAIVSGEIGIRKARMEHNMPSRRAMKDEEGYNVEYLLARLRMVEHLGQKMLSVTIGNEANQFLLVNHDQKSRFTLRIRSVTDLDARKWPWFIWPTIGRPLSLGPVQRSLMWVAIIVPSLLAFLLPYLFIFLVTRFKKQDSTVQQRAWMMAWIVANQIAHSVIYFLIQVSPGRPSRFEVLFAWARIFSLYFILPILFIPAIGGFVMVGKMMLEFGNCSPLP